MGFDFSKGSASSGATTAARINSELRQTEFLRVSTLDGRIKILEKDLEAPDPAATRTVGPLIRAFARLKDFAKARAFLTAHLFRGLARFPLRRLFQTNVFPDSDFELVIVDRGRKDSRRFARDSILAHQKHVVIVAEDDDVYKKIQNLPEVQSSHASLITASPIVLLSAEINGIRSVNWNALDDLLSRHLPATYFDSATSLRVAVSQGVTVDVERRQLKGFVRADLLAQTILYMLDEDMRGLSVPFGSVEKINKIARMIWEKA